MSRKFEIIKDFNDERLIFHKQQDCSDILEANAIERNNAPQDLSFGRKIASVPIDVLDAWRLHEGIDYRKIKSDPEMKKRFFAKLNSREWNQFKTYSGSI